jgi:hypothetical protein
LPGPGDGFGMLTTRGRPGVPCLSGWPRRAVPCLSWLCGGRNAGLGLPHWSCAPHRHLGWPTLRSRMNGKWRFGLIMVHSDERARALVGPGRCRSPRGHRERGTRPAVSRFKTTAHLLRVSAETFGASAGMILRAVRGRVHGATSGACDRAQLGNGTARRRSTYLGRLAYLARHSLGRPNGGT